jgi:hypothetical protein
MTTKEKEFMKRLDRLFMLTDCLMIRARRETNLEQVEAYYDLAFQLYERLRKEFMDFTADKL